MNRSSRPLLASFAFLAFAVAFTFAQNPGSHSIPLSTSKNLTVPAPGRLAATNSFPATIALSPDGRHAAMLNDGYGTQQTLATQSISVLDLKTNKLADFPDDRFGDHAQQSYFQGLVFSADGKHLYASVGSISDPRGTKAGDTGNGIAVYSFKDGKVTRERFISIPPQSLAAGKKVAIALRNTERGTAIPYPAGLDLVKVDGREQLLIANNYSDNVILLDPASGKISQSFDLSTNALVPSSYPYTVIASRDGKRAWCSLWNASAVAELDLAGGKVVRWINLRKPKSAIAPGSHPTAMLLSPDEKTLYVALSNADEVAAVEVANPDVVRYFSTLPAGVKFGGSYPTALALSHDGKHLFAADSSLDAVAVFDVSQSSESDHVVPALGFVPTDWYPSALAVRGNDLLIATAKGEGTGPNSQMGKVPWEVKHQSHAYIATLLQGSIARLKVSEAIGKLPELTRVVEQDNLFHSDPGTIHFANGTNPIRHVIYVIKENRTYDQILGDLGVGNGDPSLTMYGKDITPNEHKLALQFGVLDNFYDSGEVSGDGHLWSTAAITSDYNEKNWQIAYRGRERTYDFQGTVADEFPLEHHEPDVDDPATGFLWDNIARHGLTYRDYGEFTIADWCNKRANAFSPKDGTPAAGTAFCERSGIRRGEDLEANVGNPHGGPSPWTWEVPLFTRTRPTKANLSDHYDVLYPDFNTDYPDQLRADEFMNEFNAYVRARQNGQPEENQLPAFVLLYFPDDHTGGTRPGHPRPAASVADNDLAVGRLVEAVSHSPYWDDTAIFIVEDDAQNGADHVDAHRSTALVISKYSPGSSAQPHLEHHFYTTVNMIHTMEMLLGLPAMNQNDAYAPVMSGMFSGAGNQAPFTADYSNRSSGRIYEINHADAPGAAASLRMDFSHPDAAPAARLNQVLWRDQMGNAPMPPPKHTVFPAPED